MFFAGLAAGMLIGPAIEARADTGPSFDFDTLRVAVTGVGPAEDEPGFDCRIQGNRICGPTNDQGVPAGRYTTSTATTWVELMIAPVI